MKHKLSKTIFEGDHSLFCALTMNHHPVHTNAHYAKGEKHGKILVAGTYVFSLVVGLSVLDMSFDCVATLNYEDIIHHDSVFIGDTIHAESKIISQEGKVRYIGTIGLNQNDDIVISFRRNILMK